MIVFTLALFIVFGAVIMAYTFKRLGRIEHQKTKAEQINDKAIEAKHIHDRLIRDDNYARRVRERFKR